MIAYILILLGFAVRFIPHAPNMAPVAAIALFAGAYLDKRIVPWVPLVIMVASDLVLGVHKTVFFTWGAFVVIGYIGMLLRERKVPGAIFATTVFSALFFFAVTNFGVWMASGLYPHTVNGFLTCYAMAVPFLRNTLVSNVVFSLVLFGTYELAIKLAGESKYKRILIAS